VLCPAGVFPEEVFNVEQFQTLCPHADDVWFKAMTTLQGVACCRCNRLRNFSVEVPFTQRRSPYEINHRQGKIDAQVDAVFEAYEVMERLKASGAFRKKGMKI